MADKVDFGQRLNNFYRVQYAWLLRMLNVLLIVMGVLFGVILYLDYNKPRPDYFQFSPDGSYSRIYGLSRPMVGTKALREWAGQAAISAYTYNFNDYATRFEETKGYFTPSGWSAFMEKVNQANIIDDIITKQLIVSAVVTGVPVVKDQRIINDKWTWSVQCRILVSYRGGVEPYQEELVVSMIITRVPSREVPKGIAIVQFFAAPAGGRAVL